MTYLTTNSLSLFPFPGEVLDENAHNYDLIIEGEHIISNYIKTVYNRLYPPEIVEAIHSHLTSVDMLSHIGTHIGLKDIVCTNVS